MSDMAYEEPEERDELELERDEEAKAEPLVYDEDAPNLVEAFEDHEDGRKALKDIAQYVTQTFESAWEGSERQREDRAKDWRIFIGDLPKKDAPFEHAANMHVPIMLENLSRLVFRSAGELFGDWSNVFGVVPLGPEDVHQAEILSKHGNWQIRENIPDFTRQQHRGLMMFYTHGDVVCHSYWDSGRRQNRHDMLTVDEFITPYTYTTMMPDFSDCPFYCRVRRYYKHELQRMRGTWVGIDECIERKKPRWEDEPDQPMRDGVSKVEGITFDVDNHVSPYKIVQWEGWLDLPNQESQRFCQVYFEPETKNILQLMILEEPSWQERMRYESQIRSRDDYYMALADYRAATEQQQAMAQQAQVSGMPAPMVDIPAPVMPSWMNVDNPSADPDKMKYAPIYMFAHGVCIEPLVGNLGFGFGKIQADFNRAANTSLNQFVDSATLANCNGLITSALVQFNKPFTHAPGQIHVVKGLSGDELRKNIMPLEYKPANPQLFDLVRYMYEIGQSSIQSPNVLSGEPGKSGETFRGISARIEQATKQLSVSTRKYADFLTQILKNNARLNAIYLPDEEIIYVADAVAGMREQIAVSRGLYQRNYNVVFRSDMKYSSDAQRIADAEGLVQMAAQLPFLQGNVAFAYGALKKLLEARNIQDMIMMLGPQPPMPETSLGLPPPPPPGMPPGGPQGGPQGKPEAPGPNGPSGPAPTGMPN
jgi:hypothetical protein